ncbi:MAG: acyl-CoA dehydrogenase [Pseudomonadota bacterium]
MLNPNDEQRLIQESARRLLDTEYAFEARQKRLAEDQEFSAELWRQFAELGWLGLALPEDIGGFGGSDTEAALLMQEFGRRIVVEPYLMSVVLGGGLVATGAQPELRQRVLQAMMAGDLQLAVALAEPGARYELQRVQTEARAADGGYRLSGRKAVVLNGSAAHEIVVVARTSGSVDEERGLTLFVVPADADGVRITGYRLNDGQRAADIELTQVAVGADRVLGDVDAGFELLDGAVDRATVAACAEALGAMDAVMDMTAEYLKTREQFGRPLSANQALKFRMVDLHFAVEESRSMTQGALHALNEAPAARRAAVSAMKYKVGQTARLVGQEGIQLHGAIGMTEEYAVGHYYKRLETLRLLFGDPEYHLARYGRWRQARNH